MTEKQEPLIVKDSDDGAKLKRFIHRHFPTITNQIFFKVCHSGELRVNSKRVKGMEILSVGDIIRIPPLFKYLPEEVIKTEDGSKFSDNDLKELKKSIIFEDSDVVVFNKPAGLATQGGTGIRKSLDKMASALFPNENISLIHRLDRETSGLILCAKNTKSAQILSKSFVEKETKKQYIALVIGNVSPAVGEIKTFISKGKVFKTKQSADKYEKDTGEKVKIAITNYEVLENIPNTVSLILFKPETGRTHQLRLHSSFILGTPILGDNLYGGTKNSIGLKAENKLFLLSYKLSFKHPKTGKIINVVSPIPDFMKSVLSYLEIKVKL